MRFLILFLTTIILCASVFAQEPNSGCIVVGHRGSSRIAPENTVAAARLAWQQGAQGVEVDVHLSLDNRIIVNHDYGTKRTAGIDYKISETSYDVLKDLDVGSWKSEAYKGEPIPLLSQVVEALPAARLLVIEIKSDKKIVPYIHEEFHDHPKVNQFIFIAFNYETILAVKKAFPPNKAFWLSGSFKEDPEKILSKVKNDGLDGVDLNYRIITRELVDLAGSLGLEVHTWTVNNLEKAIEMKAVGVKSITTDIPDTVLEALNQGE